MITKDDFEILKRYEYQLRTSQVNYVRGLYSKDVEIIKEICSHYNIKLTNPNCGSCVLGAVKQLSNLYFEYQLTCSLSRLHYKQSVDVQPKTKSKKTKKTKNKKLK